MSGLRKKGELTPREQRQARRQREDFIRNLNTLSTWETYWGVGRTFNGVRGKDDPECEIITFIIKLGHSWEASETAKFGHAGIAIGTEYYDYGPRGGYGKAFTVVPGIWWWDNPNRPIHQDAGKTDPADVDLADILAGIESAAFGGGRHTLYGYEPRYDVFMIEWCVSKKTAKKANQYWDDLYRRIEIPPKSFLQRRLEGGAAQAKYCVPGEHCTSEVIRSILTPPADPDLEKETWWYNAAGSTTPQQLLKQLSGKKHQCGPDKGQKVWVRQIKWEEPKP